MAEKHLSELCASTDVEELYAHVRQRAGDGPHDAYPPGVWGYQDSDGRTAYHWALALRNFELAATLAGPPHHAPVLTLDEDRATPLLTLCSVNAPEAVVDDVLQRSAAAFTADFVDYCRRLDTSGLPCWDAEQGRPAPVPFREESFAAAAPEAAPEERVARVLNWCDAMGNSALLSAVSRGHKGLVQHLLARGADLRCQNSRGQTALHRAVSRGHLDLVELLIQHSQRLAGDRRGQHRQWVNLPDYRGDTALFYASMENNEELGRYLLQHGADRDVRNKAGKQFWEV